MTSWGFRHYEDFFEAEFVVSSWGKSGFRVLRVSLQVFFGTVKMIKFQQSITMIVSFCIFKHRGEAVLRKHLRRTLRAFGEQRQFRTENQG